MFNILKRESTIPQNDFVLTHNIVNTELQNSFKRKILEFSENNKIN